MKPVPAFTIPLILLAGLAAGCSGSEGSGKSVDIGETFLLKMGESARVGDNLRLSFEGVPDDSRCPEGVQCVTEGNARVNLKYITPDHPPLDFSLNTMRRLTRDTVIQHYRIALADLTPRPKAGTQIQPGEYQAQLRVTRE